MFFHWISALARSLSFLWHLENSSIFTSRLQHSENTQFRQIETRIAVRKSAFKFSPGYATTANFICKDHSAGFLVVTRVPHRNCRSFRHQASLQWDQSPVCLQEISTKSVSTFLLFKDFMYFFPPSDVLLQCSLSGVQHYAFPLMMLDSVVITLFA